MGTLTNIPARVTECSVLVIGIRGCSTSIAQVDLRSINSVCRSCPVHQFVSAEISTQSLMVLMLKLELTAKLYASPWRLCQEGQKDYRSSFLLVRQQVNMNNITTKNCWKSSNYCPSKILHAQLVNTFKSFAVSASLSTVPSGTELRFQSQLKMGEQASLMTSKSNMKKLSVPQGIWMYRPAIYRRRSRGHQPRHWSRRYYDQECGWDTWTRLCCGHMRTN